jgi:hypothetical protein
MDSCSNLALFWLSVFCECVILAVSSRYEYVMIWTVRTRDGDLCPQVSFKRPIEVPTVRNSLIEVSQRCNIFASLTNRTAVGRSTCFGTVSERSIFLPCQNSVD